MSRRKVVRTFSHRERAQMWHKLWLLSAIVLPAKYARHYCQLSPSHICMSQRRDFTRGVAYKAHAAAVRTVITDPCLVPCVLDADARHAELTWFWPIELPHSVLPVRSRELDVGFQLFIRIRKHSCWMYWMVGHRSFSAPWDVWHSPGQAVMYDERVMVDDFRAASNTFRWHVPEAKPHLMPLIRRRLCDVLYGLEYVPLGADNILTTVSPWHSILAVASEQLPTVPSAKRPGRLLHLDEQED